MGYQTTTRNINAQLKCALKSFLYIYQHKNKYIWDMRLQQGISMHQLKCALKLEGALIDKVNKDEFSIKALR